MFKLNKLIDHPCSPIPSIGSGDRKLPNIVFALQLATATAPASYKAADVTSYLLNANGETANVKILTGAGITPTNVESAETTEGDKVVQARDIAEVWQMVAQTITEYKAIKTLFQGKKCKIVGLVCNPDIAVATDTAIMTATAGDELLISHIVTLDFMSDRRNAQEWQIPITFSKRIAGTSDSWDIEEDVIADA